MSSVPRSERQPVYQPVLPLIQLPLFPEGKRCRKCGLTRPLDAFHEDKTRRDGRFPYCRWCESPDPRRRQEWDLMRAVGLKWCNRCQQWLMPYLFNKDHWQRDGLQTSCRSCSRARERAYDAAHPEKVRAESRQYYWAHHAQVRARRPEHYRKYAEERRAAARKRYACDPEKHRQISREWRERHQEQVKATAKRYQQKNHSFILDLNRRRRARKLKAEGSHTRADLDLIFAAQAGLCAYCGITLSKPIHVDHKIPLSRGGSDYADNLCLSCASCNNHKHTKTDVEYRALLARRATSPE